jgi:hypothetical protein
MRESTKNALKLLGSPYFFRELLSAMGKAGLVGEERSAQVVYVVGTSRLLAKPLCLFIKGPSSVGKNFLADIVLGFLPSSAVQLLTSSSTRSWNYVGRKLAHKIVYIKEQNEAAGPIHPTRLLISERELVHMVTVRKAGRFVQERRVTKGPIASISTTTEDRVEVDDETRHVSIWLDETPEQTTRIMRGAFETENGLATKELEVWHEIQRLLEKRAALHIDFPGWFKSIVDYVRNDNLWARRYFAAFLQACRTVALIRSFRQDDQELKRSKRILLKFTDFAITALIFNPVFSQSLDRAGDHDLGIQQHVRRVSNRKGGQPVRALDLAQELNISSDRAYSLLRKAALAGTIFRANQPAKANLKLYLPATTRSFLPEPVEVMQQMQGAPKRVKFVHPLTGEWVIYSRRRSDKKE